VSQELAEQLRQQVMGQVEAAALVAAAAGQPFDLAAKVQQMLPVLAQQVAAVGLADLAAD
jgi:Asp/Glu/hydantoin racemase